MPKVREIKIKEHVYIGKGERDKIALIKSRIAYGELTGRSAKGELPLAVQEVIKKEEPKFVAVFNERLAT